MTSPSTLPAEALHKAHIRAYSSGTHKADVQLVSSMPTTLPDVRVSTNIPAADCVVGRECTVLFFNANNPTDAVVVAVQGALPSGGGGGSAIWDTDTDTGIDTEASADEDILRLYTGPPKTQRGLLDSVGLQLKGVLTLMDSTPDATKWLNISPAFPSGNALTGIALNPTSPVLTGVNARFYGLIGAPLATIPSGSTGAVLQGLNFFAGLGGGGGGAAATALQCIYTRLAVMGFTGTIALADHHQAASPLILGGAPSITQYIGLDLGNMGSHAAIVDAFGVRIANMSANTGLRHLIEAGPASPYFRVVGGAVPPANTSHCWLDFGGTLRRVSRNGATGVLSAF